jgi:hypothetical protein
VRKERKEKREDMISAQIERGREKRREEKRERPPNFLSLLPSLSSLVTILRETVGDRERERDGR